MATAGAAPAAFPDRSADDGSESMSDAELVQLLVRGSQEAIAFLYDRHASLVFAAALRSSGDIEGRVPYRREPRR